MKLSVLVVFLVTLLALPSLATSYVIHDLGTLGGDSSNGYSINSSGTVAGTARISNGTAHAFRWSSATGMIDLGTLGGSLSMGFGINDNGDVVGSSQTYKDRTSAFLCKADGTMIDIGTLGGNSGTAIDINNHGQVVGSAATANGKTHAFFWDGAMHDLGTLDGDVNSSAVGINDQGQVICRSETGSFVWDAKTQSRTQVINSGFGLGIGEDGTILGTTINTIGENSEYHAMVWRDGVPEEIVLSQLGWGYIRNTANAINNQGQIVGSRGASLKTTTLETDMDGYVWHNGIETILPGLDELGWTTARDINDSGWIIGTALDNGGNSKAVIWQPVPEPSSLIVLTGGLFSILGLIRRRA